MIVLKPGSKTKIQDLEVVIGGVRLYGIPTVVTYEVVWWVGGERKSAWVDDFELSPSLDPDDQEYIGVGFR